MKSKLSWIPFILLLPAAGFLKLATALFPDGIFGFDALQLDYLYMGCAALMFLFAALFCLIDRKIAPQYEIHRNIPAGLVGMVLALLLAADGADVLLRIFSAGLKDALTIIAAVLALVSAIIFVVMGLNHIVRSRDIKRFSLLYALPAILSAVRMIISFVSFTTISIRLADVSRLIGYICAAMFLFYYANILAQIKNKSAVKMCFVFGFSAVVALLPYGVYHLIFTFDTEVLMNNVEPAEMLLIGIYVLAVLIEMTAFALDRNSIVAPAEKEEEDLSEKKLDGFIATNIAEDENDSRIDDEAIKLRDTEGFLYRESENPEDKEKKEGSVAAASELDNYLTEAIDEEAEDNPDDDRPSTYVDKLDDIDKLILEITEKID